MNRKRDANNKFKLNKLKVKYYFHQILQKIQMSNIWFAFSISLSLFILFPSLHQSIPVIEMINQNGIFQYKLSLSGQLLLPKDASVQYPITVAVGGYSQKIMVGNDFSLEFLAASKFNIPIVISDESGQYIVEHLTFDNDFKEATFYFGELPGDLNE